MTNVSSERAPPRDVCALLAGERRLHDHHAWLTEQLRSADDDEGSA